jgi:hypothetical protein
MNTPRKFWLVLIGAVLAMGIIACSCGSILPTLTASPQPLLRPSPTASPQSLLQPSPTLPPTTVPGMAGRWTDPDTTGTVTTIIAVGDGYAVESVINSERGGNELVATNWANGVLTWTYCIPEGNCITTVTVSLDGNSLHTTWTDDNGNSGETTFLRLA